MTNCSKWHQGQSCWGTRDTEMGGLRTEPEVFMVPTDKKSRDGGTTMGCPRHLWSLSHHGLCICIHPQLLCSAREQSWGERVFSPLGRKMTLSTWNLMKRPWQRIPDERDKNRLEEILQYKPGLCFMFGLLLIFCFQPTWCNFFSLNLL